MVVCCHRSWRCRRGQILPEIQAARRDRLGQVDSTEVALMAVTVGIVAVCDCRKLAHTEAESVGKAWRGTSSADTVRTVGRAADAGT